MIHYAQHIHQYDSANNIDTEHDEVTYKFLMKIFFNWTNKQKSFQQQLLLHNTCHLNLLIMKNLILWKEMWNSMTRKNSMIALITQSSWAFSLKKINELSIWKERKQVQCADLDVKQWCLVFVLNTALDILKLFNALTVFVCNCQNAVNEISITDNDLNQRVKDSSDVKLYYICVHGSLKCWKWNKKNIHDLKSLISKRVYYILNWQNRVKT